MRGMLSLGGRVRLNRNSGTLLGSGLLGIGGTLEEHGLLIPCGTLRGIGLLGIGGTLCRLGLLEIIGLLVATIARRKLKGKLFLIFLSSVGA